MSERCMCGWRWAAGVGNVYCPVHELGGAVMDMEKGVVKNQRPRGRKPPAPGRQVSAMTRIPIRATWWQWHRVMVVLEGSQEEGDAALSRMVREQLDAEARNLVRGHSRDSPARDRRPEGRG